MKNKQNRRYLNRLITALTPLIAAAQETADRRKKARLLKQAHALRGRPVSRSSQVARFPHPLNTTERICLADALDRPLGQPTVTAELVASWDNWDRWAYGGYDPSNEGRRFSEARNGPLKRQVWDCFRRGMTAEQIARTVTYTLERVDPRDASGHDTMFASPQWVQAVISEGTELIEKRTGKPTNTVVSRL